MAGEGETPREGSKGQDWGCHWHWRAKENKRDMEVTSVAFHDRCRSYDDYSSGGVIDYFDARIS